MEILKNEQNQGVWKGGAGPVFVLVSLIHFTLWNKLWSESSNNSNVLCIG